MLKNNSSSDRLEFIMWLTDRWYQSDMPKESMQFWIDRMLTSMENDLIEREH